jgi:hypothetical protein
VCGCFFSGAEEREADVGGSKLGCIDMWQGLRDEDDTNGRIPPTMLIIALNKFEYEKRGAAGEPKYVRGGSEKSIGLVD